MVQDKKSKLTVLLLLLVFLLGAGGFYNSSTSQEKAPLKLDNEFDLSTLETGFDVNKDSENIPAINERKISAEAKVTSEKSIAKQGNPSKSFKDQQKYLNGKFIKLASFEPISKGTKCGGNGYIINEGYDVNGNEALDQNEISSIKYVCDDEVAEKLASIDPKKIDYFVVNITSDKNHNGKVDATEKSNNR